MKFRVWIGKNLQEVDGKIVENPLAGGAGASGGVAGNLGSTVGNAARNAGASLAGSLPGGIGGSAGDLVEGAADNAPLIQLSEYEITDVQIRGFSSSDDEKGADGINDGISRVFHNKIVGVKTKPNYKVNVKCKIRSVIEQNSMLGAVTEFGQNVGAFPTSLGDYEAFEQNIKDTFKIKSLSHGINLFSVVGTETGKLWKEFKISNDDSAENCINIKKWFDMYNEFKAAQDAQNNENNTNQDGTNGNGDTNGSNSGQSNSNSSNISNNSTSTPAAGNSTGDESDGNLENSSGGTPEDPKLDEKVYRDVYIEVVLSDIQSFYYHFKNMYISDFEENFTTEEGACSYEFEMLQYFAEGNEVEMSDMFSVRKATFTDKITKGFKVLQKAFSGGGLKGMVSSGGGGSFDSDDGE